MATVLDREQVEKGASSGEVLGIDNSFVSEKIASVCVCEYVCMCIYKCVCF